MKKEQFEEGLEAITETVKDRVLATMTNEDLETELKNYKTICDLRYSYLKVEYAHSEAEEKNSVEMMTAAKKNELEERKIEYTHLENIDRLTLDDKKAEYSHAETNDKNSNEAEKLWKDVRNDEQNLELKAQQMRSDKKKERIELAKDIVFFVLKGLVLVGTVAGAYQFETGGSFTSSVGRAVIPTLARNAVNNVKL